MLLPKAHKTEGTAGMELCTPAQFHDAFLRGAALFQPSFPWIHPGEHQLQHTATCATNQLLSIFLPARSANCMAGYGGEGGKCLARLTLIKTGFLEGVLQIPDPASHGTFTRSRRRMPEGWRLRGSSQPPTQSIRTFPRYIIASSEQLPHLQMMINALILA